MAKIEGSIVIAQSVEVVFWEVADIRNEPSYNPNMLKVKLDTGEPIGSGSEFIATVKSRNETMDMQIIYTDFTESQYIGSQTISKDMQVSGGLTFSPVEQGTKLSWNWNVQLDGNLTLFSPLISLMGRKQEEKIWQGLKNKLEN